MQEIQIQFNPQKIYKRIIFSLIALGVGIWFAFGDTSVLSQIPKLDSPNFRKYIGWLTIALTLAGFIFLVKCLLSKTSGLILDRVGIEDNSQLISKGIIYWNDIDSVEQTSIGLSFLKMPTIKINFKDNEQKPRYISSGLLKITDKELKNEIELYWKKTTANSR